MSFEEIISKEVQKVIEDFLYAISENYNISYEDLHQLSFDGTKVKNDKCPYKLTRGKNKGNMCGAKTMDNGYCGKHQNQLGGLTNGTKKPGKKVTKTELDIQTWLSAAVPKDEVVLKRCSKGLIHEDTEYIFNEDYIVIGVKSGKGMIKLAHTDVEYCERHGWEYAESQVETDEEW